LRVNQIVEMSQHLFSVRATRRGFFAAGAAAAATIGNPCFPSRRERNFFVPEFASRVPNPGADETLAAYLGDGKEANGKTNRPENQTNPALFAAPHSFQG
jgi:hypothetical protein